MARYLIVNSSENTIEKLNELDRVFLDNIDEIILECEVIDIVKMKFYRPCGWLDIK
jgi:DNA-binding Xre family transcriptional regulator